MKQVASLISTYSSDEFGICSALFELGGMVVMHDASGCNSTYTTHDEPRWYDMDSMIYISAISEMEAIMGDDSKLIEDVIETANTLKPAFIAIVGAPIPYMIGTDFKAIAEMIEQRTGIPTFGFEANGMNDYIKGVSMALKALVERFCDRSIEKNPKKTVNILGTTPLDFALNGSVEAIREWLKTAGFGVTACMCMGSQLEDIKRAGEASVNLVVSAGGLEAAKALKALFGTPYVVGVPVGDLFSGYLAGELRRACDMQCDIISYHGLHGRGVEVPEIKEAAVSKKHCKHQHVAIIGEAVYAKSLATAIEMTYDTKVCVYCPLTMDEVLLGPEDRGHVEEDVLMTLAETVDAVIADPLYAALYKDKCDFYELPHEAFSGRIYDKVNPNLIGKSL